MGGKFAGIPARKPVTVNKVWRTGEKYGMQDRMSHPFDPRFIGMMADLHSKLEALRSEHRDLDDIILRLQETAPFDQLQLQRLKKRKLLLKDQIIKLESKLLPDIIA